jgi:hypothetical protein
MPTDLVALSRPEFIGDIPFVANTVQTLPTRGGSLPGDLFLYGLLLEVEMRDTIAVAAMASEHADSPYSIVDEINIEGLHRVRKQTERFYQLRGPDIRQLALGYGSRAPFSTGQIGVAAVAKDIRFFLPIVFPPEKLPLIQQVAYLLDAPNYDNLVLSVKWADGLNFGPNGAGTTHTFAGFGGVGVARCRVHGIFASFGRNGAPGIVPARVWRFFQEITSTVMTGGGTDQRLFNLNRGHIIRSFLAKLGTKGVVTAGNNAYATLSQTIANDLRVMRGTNRQIRHFTDQFSAREYGALGIAITLDNGYALIDFAENGDVRSALDTQGLVAGPTGDVDLFLQSSIVGAAAQGALLVTQEIRGLPVGF